MYSYHVKLFLFQVVPNQRRYTVANGESITLQCTIEGCNEKKEGVWKTKVNNVTDGTLKITNAKTNWNERTKMLTSFYTIESARPSDSGFYNYCLLGLKSQDIKLNVIRSKFKKTFAITFLSC